MRSTTRCRGGDGAAKRQKASREHPPVLPPTPAHALSDRLVCGECGTLYRRCTWTRPDGKRVVWRCVSRLTTARNTARPEYAGRGAAQQAIIAVSAHRPADGWPHPPNHGGVGGGGHPVPWQRHEPWRHRPQTGGAGGAVPKAAGKGGG